MPKYITIEQLRKLSACADQRERFEKRFGDRVEVSEELAAQVAHEFDIDWCVNNLLSDAALRAEYARQDEPLWVEYDRQCDLLWAEYERQREPLRAEYERQDESPGAEYKRQCDLLWAEYDRQDEPLWAKYKRQRASLFARLYLTSARARRRGAGAERLGKARALKEQFPG
jgi:hypothetical protein